jgi:hypothetical protein
MKSLLRSALAPDLASYTIGIVVKRHGHEANHSYLSSADVKNDEATRVGTLIMATLL